MADCHHVSTLLDHEQLLSETMCSPEDEIEKRKILDIRRKYPDPILVSL